MNDTIVADEILHTSNGKRIEIYHNLFSYEQRFKIYTFFNNSFYRLSSGDHPYSKIANQLFCNLSQEDVEKSGIFSNSSMQELFKKHNLTSVSQCRVNLSNCAEYNTVHHDGCKFTFLYYCNLEWKLEWGGQTLFLNEDLTKVEHCSLTQPGKLVVFEGTIPHMLVNPTIYAEKSRLVFVLQMN